MSSSKVEKAIVLVSQIESTRAELARLEAEFEELVVGRVRKEVAVADGRRTRKPSRSKIKLLRLIRNIGKPVRANILSKKTGFQKTALYRNLRILVESGEIVKTGRGEYAIKA